MKGRPSKFSKKISEELCERLAGGESLRAICESEDMPGKTTVMRWLLSDKDELKDFRDHYAQAREIQYQLMADEIIDICDDGYNDYMLRANKEGDEQYVINPEAIGRSRLRVDTRKWFMSKVLPKFSEKPDLGDATNDMAIALKELAQRLPA